MVYKKIIVFLLASLPLFAEQVEVTARNVCYLINKLTDGLNPMSISSNNPLQPMDIGAVPFYRTYAFNLTVRF